MSILDLTARTERTHEINFQLDTLTEVEPCDL